jgi:hypothetical protein
MGCGLSKAHVHPEVLVSHGSARTTFHGRLLIVQRHRAGCPVTHTALQSSPAETPGTSRGCPHVPSWPPPVAGEKLPRSRHDQRASLVQDRVVDDAYRTAMHPQAYDPVTGRTPRRSFHAYRSNARTTACGFGLDVMERFPELLFDEQPSTKRCSQCTGVVYAVESGRPTPSS